jgi:aminoglycoside 3-N-acetyltransferase
MAEETLDEIKGKYMPETISKSGLVRDLRNLGLSAGDTVLVHSSLSSLGRVDGGPEAVIDALLEVLGPQGTLLMPSFQKGSEHVLLRQGCTFDLRTSPSELGIITETFRRRPGVTRSLSPTHCTAAIGLRADELLADHQSCLVSVGRGSPYDKLVRSGGRILLLGVTHAANTTLHLLENINGAPTVCRELFSPVVIDMNGKQWIVPTHPHMPGLKRRYDRVQEDFPAPSFQHTGLVGRATAHLIDAQTLTEVIGNKIRENPLYLCEPFTP